MQKRVFFNFHIISTGVLLICLFESISSFNIARRCDPLALTLEQILADVTFEIVPCPTCPNVYIDPPSCQCGISNCPTCPTCPNVYIDPPSCQCGISICPTYPTCPYFYCDPPSPCEIPCSPCPNICFNPMPCDQWGQCWGSCPACSCHRDIMNPCNIFEEACPLYLCLESCNCDYMPQPSPPCIYFPEVEYPMSVMDLRPYYLGSCWCT